MSNTRAIRFDNQVVVVTGAGRGLGAAYAKSIAALGGSVVVHDAGVAPDGSGFDPSVADTVVRQIEVAGGAAAACHENLDNVAACERIIAFAVEKFGKLDALVSNAGLVVFASIEETDATLWRRMMAIGVDAPFHLARAAIPHMKKRGYGRIVLTTSGRAMKVDDCVPDLAAYSTSKMAQVGLMVGLAAELKGTDVHINAVSPVAATRVLRRSAPELTPELVAPGVVFLASSACNDSGAVLNAAGGRFSIVQIEGGAEIDLGRMPISPEQFAARWSEISRHV